MKEGNLSTMSKSVLKDDTRKNLLFFCRAIDHLMATKDLKQKGKAEKQLLLFNPSKWAKKASDELELETEFVELESGKKITKKMFLALNATGKKPSDWDWRDWQKVFEALLDENKKGLEGE